MSINGILPVIPTPFRDGEFDDAGFERLLEHMLPFVDGYTLMGSTGEAPSLSDTERRTIVARALALTPPEKAVVVGVSHTSSKAAAELVRHAQDNGARGVLACAPFYFPNTADGILEFLRPLDAALEVDLVFYDNPVTTKTQVQAQWVVEWARELERLTAVKITDHDLGKIPVWHASGLNVLAGDDVILSQFLAAGVDGAMVIAPALLPASFAAVWEALGVDDLERALAIFSRELAPIIHAFGVGEEIATTKVLLADLGIFSTEELHAPLLQVDPARRAQLRQAWEVGRAAAETRDRGEVVA